MTLDAQPIGVLAQAARDCIMFSQARRLAEWVGDGKRITPKQVLRPIDVPAAAQALGITAPERIHTAATISALHRPWKVALAVGFLHIADGRAVAGPVPDRLTEADGNTVLDLWLTALIATLAAGIGNDDGEVGAAVFARIVMTTLATGPAPSSDVLWTRGYEALGFDSYVAAPFFTAFLSHDDRFGAVVDQLVESGAATRRGKRVTATPLGSWAAREMEARIPEPVSPDLSAAELIVRLTETDDDPWYAAQPWLNGRNPLQAARNLLQAAATATPLQRITAIEIVNALGEPADTAWREVTTIANLAAHAREALTGWDESATRSQEDTLWLAVEYATAALIEHGPDEAWSCVDERLSGRDFAAVIGEIEGSEHPDATALAEALSAFIAAGEKPTSTRVCQLKISLKRAKPPIWRRVLVPATSRLDQLHQVIQIVMEWDGDHLHVFSVGRESYGDPFYSPDSHNEAALRLIDAFTPTGKTIGYAYDFGADWLHDVTLERVLDLEAGTTYPVCVTGSGDSPREDWAEVDGHWDVPFDRDKINGRLAGLTRHPALGPQP